MKDKMKFLAVAAIVAMCQLSFGVTPLQQALEVEQDMKNVIEALVDVNQPVQTFKQVPSKIKALTRIGDFWDGNYSGPITLGNKTYGYQLLKNVPGEFDVYAPNLTSASDSLFAYAIGVNNFTAPKMTTMGSYAFQNCTALCDVQITNCAYVGYYSFDSCTALTNINAPKVTSTSSYAFNNCSKLTEFQCQPLTTVNDYAFYGCTSLTNVSISENSCNFNSRCFYNCQNLVINSWPATLAVGQSAFYNCRSLKDINPILQKYTAFTDNQDVTFALCKGLTSLESDNLTTINSDNTFTECTSVTNISFPNLVAIANQANCDYVFNYMINVRRLHLPKLKTLVTNGGYRSIRMFGYMMSLEDLELPSLVQIGSQNSTWYAAYYTFTHCESLKNVSMPALKTMYAYGLFSNCYRLKNISMPSLEEFYQYRTFDSDSDEEPNFYFCNQLEEVNFPSLKTLSNVNRMFCKCTSLKSFSAPQLTNIYQNVGTKNMAYMFRLCPALTDVTFGLKASELLAYPNFTNIADGNKNVTFHCPADFPENVDVMYLDGAWKAVTNGTFKLVEWISSDGNQYINTGYTHKTNTVVEIDFALTPNASPKQWEYIFGSRSDGNIANSYGMFSYTDNVRRWGYQRNSYVAGDTYTLDEETRFKAVCNMQNCVIYDSNGAALYTMTASGTPNEGRGPLAIFACNENSASGGFSPNQWKVRNMKLYRFTVKEEGETIVDLLPGAVGNGESETPCLLDAAHNWHPHFNFGTGQFAYGSVTNNVQTSTLEP